jgi:uncharacterized protein (DUF2062 family)
VPREVEWLHGAAGLFYGDGAQQIKADELNAKLGIRSRNVLLGENRAEVALRRLPSRLYNDGHKRALPWPGSRPAKAGRGGLMAEPQTQDSQPDTRPIRWWSNPRALLRYVLSLDDTPHHIALGTAIGVFWGLTPTVGVQMLLVVAVYYLCLPFFRFNVKAGLVAVYISNPLTMVPLYWFDYRVGQLLFGGEVTREQFAQILEYNGFGEWWATVLTLFVDLGWTMLVGSLIVGTVGALLTYPEMIYLLHLFRGGRGETSVSAPTAREPVQAVERRSA